MTTEQQNDKLDIVIRNEQDAYDFLKKLSDDELPELDNLNIQFIDWPVIQMKVVGERYHSTITPPIMKAFLKLQEGIYRAYAIAVYGEPKRLSEAEKKQLELVIKVAEGCSEFGDGGSINWTELFKALIAKMPSKYLLIGIMTFLVLYFGEGFYQDYLGDLKHQRELSATKETEKALIQAISIQTELTKETLEANKEIVNKVLDRHPTLEAIKIHSQETQNEFLRSASDADKVQLQGVSLTGAQAKVLASKPREIQPEFKDVRLDGMYRIITVHTELKTGFKVKIRNETTGNELTAEVQDDTFENQYKQAIQNGTFEKRPVELTINAKQKVKDGSISDAVIIKAVLHQKQK
ncbi:hypothetical protein [Haemophilus sp. SZY H51]|uniref:hypothetical protein n=1 Tax=Haemophilus sp. SZY H51 TaxID=3041427 RepID=UPI0025B0EBFA|nr:hypothetical protein [Haemophilus sp. SZY H51]MDN3211655.1 hypothetical protein [Haemophilus sp. SZY H51]